VHAWRLSSVVLIAAAFCVTTDASAADHLTPCANGLQDYYAQIETRIRQAAPDQALWKITVFPSFQPEWGIRATRSGDDYELTVVRFDRSIWDSAWVKTGRNEVKHDLSAVRARTQRVIRKISAHLFSELEAAIRGSIEEAASVDADDLNEIVETVDGVTFRFEVGESACGETHTLDRAKRAGRLAAIVLALCNPPAEDEILHMLDELPR
jgi:hypothetical protein